MMFNYYFDFYFI